MAVTSKNRWIPCKISSPPQHFLRHITNTTQRTPRAPDSQAIQVWTRTASNSIDYVGSQGSYGQKQVHPLKKIHPNSTTLSAWHKPITIDLHLPPTTFPNPSSILIRICSSQRFPLSSHSQVCIIKSFIHRSNRTNFQ